VTPDRAELVSGRAVPERERGVSLVAVAFIALLCAGTVTDVALR
jgi:hypothetical protein